MSSLVNSSDAAQELRFPLATYLHMQSVMKRFAFGLPFFLILFSGVHARSDEFEPLMTHIVNSLKQSKSLSHSDLYSSLRGAQILIRQDAGREKSFQEVLEKIAARRDMLPLLTNWTFAAFEISYGVPTRQSLEASLDALAGTTLALTMSWSNPEVSPVLEYRDKSNRRHFENFGSGLDVLWLRTAWLKAMLLIKELPHGVELIDRDVETSVVSYLNDLSIVSKALPYPVYLDHLNIFAEPKLRKFRHRDLQVQFLDRLLELSHSYMARQTSSGWYAPFSRVQFISQEALKNTVLLRATVASWMRDEPGYLLSNLDRVLEYQIMDFEGFFALMKANSSPEILAELAKSIKGRKLKALSHTAALLIYMGLEPWAVDHGLYDVKFGNQVAEEFLSIFGSIETGYYSRTLKPKGIEPEEIRASDLTTLIQTFFQYIQVSVQMTESFALELLQTETTGQLSRNPESYEMLETARLKAVEHIIGSEKMAQILEKSFTTEKKLTLEKKIRYARFLRTQMKVKNLDEISRRHLDSVKASAGWFWQRDRGPLDPKYWTRNDQSLIQFMIALNPRDPELVQFLSRAFLENNVEELRGPAALELLQTIGTASDEVRKRLERQLSFVAVGDSAGNFRTYLKLFPANGEVIARIIYLHRSTASKIQRLQAVLFQEALRNPSILEALRSAKLRDRYSDEFSEVYDGYPIDEWLAKHIEVSRSLQGLDCKVVVGDKK